MLTGAIKSGSIPGHTEAPADRPPIPHSNSTLQVQGSSLVLQVTADGCPLHPSRGHADRAELKSTLGTLHLTDTCRASPEKDDRRVGLLWFLRSSQGWGWGGSGGERVTTGFQWEPTGFQLPSVYTSADFLCIQPKNWDFILKVERFRPALAV